MREAPKMFEVHAAHDGGPRFVAHGVRWPDGYVTLRSGNSELRYESLDIALRVGAGPGAVVQWLSADPRNLPVPNLVGAEKLTATERRVLRCTAGGLNRSEAGEMLRISPTTVSNLLGKIGGKLGTSTPAESSVVGVLGGLIDLRKPLDSPDI